MEERNHQMKYRRKWPFIFRQAYLNHEILLLIGYDLQALLMFNSMPTTLFIPWHRSEAQRLINRSYL